MYLVPLSLTLKERTVNLMLENWRAICRLSKIDPDKSSILRRKSDGLWFILAVQRVSNG
jgi:hypothetical protein